MEPWRRGDATCAQWARCPLRRCVSLEHALSLDATEMPPHQLQTSAATCPRAVIYVGFSGNASAPIALGSAAFTASNIRSAYVANALGDVIVSGAVSPCVGYALAAGGTPTSLPATCVNSRYATVYAGSLLYSTASGTSGVYLLGTSGAWSSATGQTSTAVLASSGSYPTANSPGKFLFQNASTLWICDDGAATSYGIWKLTGTFGTFAGAEARPRGWQRL